MQYLYFRLIVSFMLLPMLVAAQQQAQPAQGMKPMQHNYTSFPPARFHLTDEARQANAAFLAHQELGLLYDGAPCTDCYEQIAARTATTKTFVREGSNGTELMMQTSTDALNYLSAQGQWLTISDRLSPLAAGKYAALTQKNPVIIDANSASVLIIDGTDTLHCNTDMELLFTAPDGATHSLGRANWRQHTAGSDGLWVTDVWPGIDMELFVGRGSVKTNFYIKQPMPQYSHGTLHIRDHIGSAATAIDISQQHIGNLNINDQQGNVRYRMSAATVYQQAAPQHTMSLLGYQPAPNGIDIVLPGTWLSQPAAAYPVVIDPLITVNTSSTVGGSTYSPGLTVSCDYVNAANVPPNVTITDVRWSFNYIASSGALLLNGAADYTIGTCRSPSVGGFFWFCNLASPGTCTGTSVSIFSDLSACLPPPQCLGYPLNIAMRFYQNYASTLPCAVTYISSGSPLTITVFGRTLEVSPISSAGGATAICVGQSVTLSATPTYGVPPYSYSWSPGSISGVPVTFTPAATTPYTLTVTDACGQTSTATQTIVVTPINPIAGPGQVCVGATIPLSNSVPGGSWLSAHPAVATIGSSTGIVTGIAAGTALISYITPAGCYAATTVTVVGMPAAITGTTAVCVGNSTLLSSATPGGTWASAATGTATVAAATGSVTGVAAGTTTITYTTLPGCMATATVTVHPLPVIASVLVTNPSTCGGTDGRILLTGLVPGVLYEVSYTLAASPVTISLTASATGTIAINALTAGTYTSISVRSPQGCIGTWSTPVTLVDTGMPPTPVAGTNAPLCEGSTLSLTASTVPGVTYAWAGPGGFTSTLQNPTIPAVTTAAAGTYSVTARLLGCTTPAATVNVVVHVKPQPANAFITPIQNCGGNDGAIMLTGLQPGSTYNVGMMRDGLGAWYTLTANDTGTLTVSGLAPGTYVNVFVAQGTCVSAFFGPFTFADPPPPLPPTITTNAPVCPGASLQLQASAPYTDGDFYWAGPNGFSASGSTVVIDPVTDQAKGIYTLTYIRNNCRSYATQEVLLYPPLVLDQVRADRNIIEYGDSVQLFAGGARYYDWLPHDRTNPNYTLPNPWVKPDDSFTTYTLRAVNEWGCADTASIIIRTLLRSDLFIPTAFTPNGDGKNDYFRPRNMQYSKMIDFSVFNRWGQEVYHTAYDAESGWDGSCRGRPADVGVYFYTIIIEDAFGKIHNYRGDVTLIR